MSIKQSIAVPLLLLLAAIVQAAQVDGQKVDENFYARPGVTAAEYLEARGFLAEEHFIITHDGYILLLTRGTNPLFHGGRRGLANRDPILFLHGLTLGSACFLANSYDVRPKDLSKFDLDSEELLDEPSAKSLAFLALNCGHEVWLLSRRGTFGSQRKIGNPRGIHPHAFKKRKVAQGLIDVSLNLTSLAKTRSYGGRFSLQTFSTAPAGLLNYGHFAKLFMFSLDSDFWNYSYDEQAHYDIPQAIDYVRKKTRRPKVALVGHSAGGGIALMSLILFPNLADKVSSAVLWAPSFGLGDGLATKIMSKLGMPSDKYVGSFPPAFAVLPIQASIGMLCATGLTQRTLCEGMMDLIYGLSGGKQPVFPEFASSFFNPAGSHEFSQLIQSLDKDKMLHRYDFGAAGNEAAYGQLKPPVYNASRIRLKRMSLYAGATDALVAPSDVERLAAALTVPYKFSVVKPVFSHAGFLIEENVAKTIVIPSLRDIHKPGKHRADPDDDGR